MSKGQQSDEHRGLVRSSAAEYLTFVAATGDGGDAVELRYEDENIWLTQKLMAELYGVSVATINRHLRVLREDGEIDGATIRDFLIVQREGTRDVSRTVAHYNLQASIAVGFKVNNPRAVQFRKWANLIVKDYTIQGWVMDAERLKAGHLFTDQYFARQLDLVREIRASERLFYQKVTDIYATAFDYDASARTTRDFFAMVQNKLHWAVHRHTAAELIVERADADVPHMGLTTWASAPGGKIVKSDVSIAKNYLSEDELQFLNRLVSMYLDFAEFQAMRKIPMSMQDWAARLDGFLEFNGTEILVGPGKVSAEQAKLHAETQFERYRIVQDRLFKSDFDRFLEASDVSDKEAGK
ncbi:RhuM family protein [Micropruina sp.]|uniref:RhuM family protein n=1 Tax=Micropruina sp. TaxID=2737536 RepID=UPI0039E4C229